MKQMSLKEFTGKVVENSPLDFLRVGEKLVELEGIERYFNLMFGIELDIKVKMVEKQEGRFYGKSFIEELEKLEKKRGH